MRRYPRASRADLAEPRDAEHRWTVDARSELDAGWEVDASGEIDARHDFGAAIEEAAVDELSLDDAIVVEESWGFDTTGAIAAVRIAELAGVTT